MKTGHVLIALLVVFIAGLVFVDRFYVSRLEQQFTELERQRIITSNKLATAAIVYENLNHVRDLVFKNMDFPGHSEAASHETIFFDFLTTCVNDLKLKLVSVRPVRPQGGDRITTYGYDIELTGDFFKFGELCAKMENSRRIISLESFDVSLIDDGGRSPLPSARSRRATEVTDGFKGIRIMMRVNTYRVAKTTEPLHSALRQ